MEFRVSPERRQPASASRRARVGALADALDGPQMDRLQFLLAAVRDFHHVGTLWPSSHAAAREIARAVGPGRRHIVEYGAGDGAVTAELLKVLAPEGKLLALEINEEFCDSLAEMGDDRLTVRRRDIVDFVQNGARELTALGASGFDAIVSGIPLSFHSAAERAMIVRRTHDLLAPGGVFIVYQVSPVFFPAVKRAFPKAKLTFSPRNLPPYFIAVAEK